MSFCAPLSSNTTRDADAPTGGYEEAKAHLQR